VSHFTRNLEISVIHGDGTTTAAKRRRQPGFSGHKHLKGTTLSPSAIAIAISPLIAAPWQSERIAAVEGSTATSDPHCQAGRLDLNQIIVSLDGVYDSRGNRKAIFNRMVPNIPEILRGERLPSVDASLFRSSHLSGTAFTPSSESSLGRTSFDAYCCALKGSVGCTTP